MVSEPCLAEGHVFKLLFSHLLSPHVNKPKLSCLWFVYLLCISACVVGMGLYMREDIGLYNIHCRSNPTNLSFNENWLSNMVVKPCLVKGHMFEPHHIFISLLN